MIRKLIATESDIAMTMKWTGAHKGEGDEYQRQVLGIMALLMNSRRRGSLDRQGTGIAGK